MEDGRFQINSENNGFVKRCRGLFKVGLYGEKLAGYPIDFTPVDECADAYVKLCFHNKVNNIYHLYHPQTYTIEALSRKFLCRFKKTTQPDFEKALKKWKDDTDAAVLAFYNSAASMSKHVPISSEFTINELGKLGFRWSKIGFRYLQYLKKIQ